MPAPTHLRPACALAERVLLPGDPHRALAVAQLVLEAPRMFNHARGLWGYTGTAADGEPLSVQSTGIGGPSAAVVCEELVALGARRLVRIGTCAALNGDLEAGALVTAAAVLPHDGASTALGADGALAPDPGLLGRLVEAGARAVTVASTDLVYSRPQSQEGEWGAHGAAAVDLESAAVLRVGALRGAPAASLLVVRPAEREADGDETTQRLADAGYAALEEATTP